MAGAQVAMLPDGRRLHLQHGPIDLIIEVWGAGREAAYGRAAKRFATVLDELVTELPELRRPLVVAWEPQGPVARRMAAAVRGFADTFITPMAAVAGAVADEVLAEIAAVRGVDKVYVNNGGDVALHLAEGEIFSAAVAAGIPAQLTITYDLPVRGIATSGWGGRSHSLGIADSVTVLARNAATADAAATLVANAVDLPGHDGIDRQAACALDPDSDLGDRLVTIGVSKLSAVEKDRALNGGVMRARNYRSLGLIDAAFLVLQGTCRDVDLIGAAHLP